MKNNTLKRLSIANKAALKNTATYVPIYGTGLAIGAGISAATGNTKHLMRDIAIVGGTLVASKYVSSMIINMKYSSSMIDDEFDDEFENEEEEC
jgi:hypothetical protein